MIKYLIQRSDTGEFYIHSTEPRIHVFGKGYNTRYCSWSSNRKDFFLVRFPFDSQKEALDHLTFADDISDSIKPLCTAVEVIINDNFFTPILRIPDSQVRSVPIRKRKKHK